MGDSNSDEDSGEVIFQNFGSAKKPSAVATAPPPDLKWDEGAIKDCFQLSIDSHDAKSHPIWKARPFEYAKSEDDKEALSTWKPAELKLPQWALDPSPINIEVSKT